MNTRRNFIKQTLAAAGLTLTGLSAPPAAMAKSHEAHTPWPGVIYTRDNPGKWSAKVRSHAPVVTLDGGMVRIETKHPMSSVHYIVRHTLVAEDGTVLGEKTFRWDDAAAMSEYRMEDKKGRFFATSFCNKHDFWVTEFKI